MAFSADELRVLRRALAHALQTTSHPAPLGVLRPEWSQDIQEYLRLAEAVDEAVREGGRLRAFLLADLARYREALPGSATGYLGSCPRRLAAGHVPGPDDLAALRSLGERPGTAAERERRSALLRHCEQLAEQSVRDPAPRAARRPLEPPATGGNRSPRRSRNRNANRSPRRRRGRKTPQRDRPIPTPGEVFPPRRKPAPPPESRTA